MTHEDQTEIREIIGKYRQQAQDAEYRGQISSSCRIINRHAEGIIDDVKKITEMPNFKTEAEDVLKNTQHILLLALTAISVAKTAMANKQCERN